MVNDLVSLIMRANLALAAGIVLVLLLRIPARHAFGARIAYALWALPLLASLACFLPARTEVVRLPVVLPPMLTIGAQSSPHVVHVGIDPRLLLALWIGGVVTSLIVLILRQTRFARALGRLKHRADLGDRVLAAESNDHGPAVLGVLRPVIVTPADFDARFSDDERRIVLAHERAHMAQGDPLINALAAALQCVNWFNPFVHIGVRALRVDQELACDAAVLSKANARAYAEAILKTQIAAAAPLGCTWPSPSLASLKERIAMLKHTLPSRTQRIIGVSAVGLASFTACAVAWAAQPARVVVSQPHPTVTATPMPLPPDPLAAAALTPISARVTNHEQTNDDADANNDDADDSVDDNNDDSNDDSADADDVDVDSALAGNDERRIVVENGRVLRVIHERDLTPAQRARIREALARAMAAERTAARAVAAQRTAMAQAQMAMRNAQTAQEHALVIEPMRMPEMQAEIAALEAEAAQMAALEAGSSERATLRAEMQEHAQRIRDMAEHMADEARAEASHEHNSDN